MSRITFNLAAKCDEAGRTQNQDNYWVCPDLTRWSATVGGAVGTDDDVELSEKGALLVVADGMGGMNAGEVASELVIEGIKKKFSNIPDSLLASEADVLKFIREAIVDSDESVKRYAKAHREAEGLGSTIVLLWLLGGKAYCAWCGDSRIYRYNPNNELIRLSHDHSYVQSLVDDGKITEDEAFDHPDGNVITKALGDNGSKADPELKVYDVYQRDVFMLCSDGLCGLLQDAEINKIISDNCTSSKDTLDALWEAGERAHWSDNATIDVLVVTEGGKLAKGRPDGYPVAAKRPAVKRSNVKPQVSSNGDAALGKKLKTPYLYAIALASLCLLGFALYNTFGGETKQEGTHHEFSVEAPQQEVNHNNVTENNGGRQTLAPPRNNGGPGRNNGSNTSGTGGGRPSGGNAGGSTANPGSNNSNTQHPQEQDVNTPGAHGTPSNGSGNAITEDVLGQLSPGRDNGNSESPQTSPSREFMTIYSLLKGDFETVSKPIVEIKKGVRRFYLTTPEEAALKRYIDNYSNNKALLTGSEYRSARPEIQEDIVNFDKLVQDAAGILNEWNKRKKENSSEEVPGGQAI